MEVFIDNKLSAEQISQSAREEQKREVERGMSDHFRLSYFYCLQ